MPTGYLVTLGDSSLDNGDVIGGGVITFVTDQFLGQGDWIWSGTVGGTTYTDEEEPGEYFLATDGNVYFVPEFGEVDTITSASALNPPVYSVGGDGTVSGTAGDDLIDSNYTGDGDGDIVTDGNDTIEAGDGADTVRAGDGDDSIDGGTGNDTLVGDGDGNVANSGQDTIAGGSGDDTIYGDYGDASAGTAETTQFQWNQQGISDESNVAGGVTGVTANGQIQVAMTVAQEANFTAASMETNDALYDYNGANDSSSIDINGGTAASSQDAATVSLNFAAAEAGFSNEVSNVTFGIFDLDELDGQFIDQVIISAYDADGNLVPVTMTASATTITTSVAANGVATATSILNSGGAGAASSQSGFVQVSVAGPVARIEIDYNNLEPAFGNHAINIGDLELTSIPAAPAGGNNDVLTGDAGNDTIFGQGGEDSIDGGAGSDTLYGGADNDIINDTGTEADTIYGGSGDDTVTAGGGNDLVYGGAGADSLNGGSGNDTFFGGAENDTINGDAGDDTLSGDAGDDSLLGGAGNDTIYGGTGQDSINGGTGNDEIYGGADNDSIVGGVGNDTINGGAGNDSMVGGDGSDRFVLDDNFGTDSVIGSEDTGDTDVDVLDASAVTTDITLDISAPETGTLTTGGNTATFSQIEAVETGAGDDTITGSNAADTITAGAGADVINAGSGDDVIDLGAGSPDGDADVMILANGFGNDTVSNFDAPLVNPDGSLTGVDTLDVTGLNDAGGNPVDVGDVVVTSNGSGDAVLTFPNGESLTLVGISAVDANDVDYLEAIGIPVATADGVVTGTFGSDTIDASYIGDGDGDQIDDGDALIAGEAADDDIVIAAAGDDTVIAGAGDDDVYGGDGNDSISGGAGDDTLYGDTPEGSPWFYEYYDLDPALQYSSLADAGFTNGTDNSNTPTDVGYAASIAPTDYDTTDQFALKFSTTLNVTTAGDYTFATTSDDGSKLFIDGVEVVSNDGVHGLVTVTGTPVTLSAGPHFVEIIYFEHDGGNGLSSTISGPDTGGSTVDLTTYGGLDAPSGDDNISGGTGSDTLFGGTGDDTLAGDGGNDTITGGSGDDTITLADGFGTDTIDGSEDVTGTDTDVLDASSLTTDAVVNMTGPEAGTLTTGGNTATFSNIEQIATGAGDDQIAGSSGDDSITAGTGADTVTGGAGNDTIDVGAGSPDGDADVVVLADDFGDDTVNNFDAPVTNPDGSLTGVDTLDVTGLNDAGGNPVNTDDVTVTDDGSGNALLTFPNGETITLIGIPAADAVDTDYLVAIGIPPASDGTVTGTAGADTIDAAYAGDNDGDFVDNNDAILPGDSGDDDLIYGLAGDDSILAGDGDDEVYGGADDDQIGDWFTDDGNDTFFGGAGNDRLNGGIGDDTLFGGTGNDTLTTSVGTDTVYGGTGSDTIAFTDDHQTNTIVGGEDPGDADIDVIQLYNDISTDGATVTYTGDEAGTIDFDSTPATADFSEIERVETTDYDDTVDGSASTSGIDVSTEDGDDSVIGGAGDDNIALGDGADTVEGGAGNDTIDLGTSGTPDGDPDVIILEDGFGNDTVTSFDAPTPNVDGITFTGIDTLDVTGLNDAGGDPVNTNDVTVTDDGSGNAVLTFPNGEAITLVGISPVDADNPNYLHAIGIPISDGTVSGTAGADTIDAAYTGDPDGDLVDNDDAVLAGDTGDDDLIFGYAGDDSITAGDGDDEVYGGADNDTIDGLTGADTLFGDDGNDVIYDGAGNDTTYGGAGDDVIGDSAGLLSGGSDVHYGGSGNDTIYIGNGADTAYGGADADTFTSLGSGDSKVVEGGETGTDNDTLSWAGETDAADTINVTMSGDEAGVADIRGQTVTFSEIENIVGTQGDDTINATGDTSGMGLDGQDGDDVITGGSGDDSIIGGSGNDTVDGAAGADNISGGAGDDSLAGGAGNDTIDGDSGSDTVDGGDGDDVLILDDGNDTAFGGTGNDEIYASSGTNSAYGGAGDDQIFMGSGDDTIDGGAGSDTLHGGAGEDAIIVGQSDTAFGGAGDDTFTLTDAGDTGNISIDGGSETGLDTLDFNGMLVSGSLNATDDGTGSFSGTALLTDGTTVSFSEIEDIICFTPGTKIATPYGARDIASLKVGDMVVTRDHGLQPIRWIQSRTVPAVGRFAPIRIRPGVLTGLEKDILVSPQHRMLFQGYRAELLFGESEVLIAAKHLVDDVHVTQDEGAMVTYIHMMFDEHEVVFADGAASESFHPGSIGLNAIEDEAREELFALFPELRTNANGYGPTARRCLRRHEAELVRL